MLEAFDRCGNASSVHAEGRAARAMVESARAEIAAFVGGDGAHVVFTSGGTEALNLVLTPSLLTPSLLAPPPSRSRFEILLLGAGEHAAVLAGHRFPPEAVGIVGLTRDGVLDLDALDGALARHSGRRVVLSLQAANNETGVIQPVAAAARRVHAAGGYVVCDAVQAAGRIPCDFSALGADVIVLSGHKLGGPQGVGAVCFAAGLPHIEDVLLRGGGQERGLRAGTENVAGIVGMAAAARVAAEQREQRGSVLARWRDRIEAGIERVARGAVFFGRDVERLPNTTCFALPGVEAQVLLMILDIGGIAVSSGSACSSGKVKPSHVLAAMGVESSLARGATRVSLGWTSRPEDCESFEEALENAVRTTGRRGGGHGIEADPYDRAMVSVVRGLDPGVDV